PHRAGRGGGQLTSQSHRRSERPMPDHPSVHQALTALVPLTSLVLLGTACGDDDAALPDTVEVVATDYAFAGLPARIGTDTTVTMRNDSTGEVHELVVFPLPDDIDGTAAEILAMPE